MPPLTHTMENHLTTPHSVFVLLQPGFVLLDATGPLQVFASTNNQCADEGHAPVYDLQAVSLSGGLVTSSAGVALDTRPLPPPDTLAGHTLLIPGTQRPKAAAPDSDVCVWVKAAHASTRRTASVCTGAFVLASVGVLNGRRATTHWLDAPQFKKQFPAVTLDEDAIHTRDGKVWTSAGISAGIDLALALVEDDLGRPLALRVAHRLVVYLKRPGGQRQYSAELLAQVEEGSFSGRLTRWLMPRLGQQVDVADMADAMSVSVRTLHRQLSHETGLAPAAWLRRLRTEVACRLLAQHHLSIKHVAQKSGFGDEYNMRRAFHLALRISPSDYRSRLA